MSAGQIGPPRTSADDADASALADIRRELREQRVLLERLVARRPAPLTREDRERLTVILPAIVGAWGSEPFASRDLATNAGVRVVLRGLSVKQVAQLLSRAAGIPIEGLMIERAGHELNVTLWRVVACDRGSVA